MIELVHRFRCSIEGCGATAETAYRFAPGDRPAVPSTPPGWMCVASLVICPGHPEVTLTVKGGPTLELRANEWGTIDVGPAPVTAEAEDLKGRLSK